MFVRRAAVLLSAVALGIPTGVATPAAGAAIPEWTPRAEPVTVVAVGDISCEPGEKATSDSCRQAATARLAAQASPDLVLALGDTQYERGSLRDYRSSYDASWGALKDVTEAIPGNHEYRTSGARGFFRYFGVTSPGYRVVTAESWRVYLLNSNCDAVDCSEQRDWFRADLAAHPTTCSAMALHYPRYSSGEHGSDPAMARFWRIASQGGVDVALAGHDHDYERFAPMDGDGHVRRSDGIVSFVVGTGGRSLYDKTTTAHGSRYFRSSEFGVLELDLGEGRVDWRFRTLGGHVRDAGGRTCR